MILDAYAVIAFLRDEPAADVVSALLAENLGASLTAIGVAEVLDRLVRLDGTNEEEAVLDLAQLRLSDPEPITVSLSAAAGLLRGRRYHRTRCAVSLADCSAAEAVAVEHLERPVGLTGQEVAAERTPVAKRRMVVHVGIMVDPAPGPNRPAPAGDHGFGSRR